MHGHRNTCQELHRQEIKETKQFKKEICYLDDEVKSKEIKQEKCRIVDNPVVQTYRVRVPVCEEQTEMVQTEKCIDGELVVVEEPCVRHVVREQEEVRTQECQQPQLVFEESTCTIDYCVKTPKKHEIPCMEETVYKLEPVTQKRKVTACVPEVQRTTYEVQVTKMFPKTVFCCQACAARLRHGSGLGGDGGDGAGIVDKLKDHHGKLKDTLGGLKDKIHKK
jgi:hypothetical protein